MADGTAQQCGRVGSCHIYFKKPSDLCQEAFCIIWRPVRKTSKQVEKTKLLRYWFEEAIEIQNEGLKKRKRKSEKDFAE